MAYHYHRGKRVSLAHATMLRAYENAKNRPVYINQGARTLVEQAAFFANYLRNGWPLAARPWGGAPHIKWGKQHHALDINWQVVQSVADFYRYHGVPVSFNVRGEPWHMDVLDERQLIRAAERLSAENKFPVIKPGDRGDAVKRLKKLMWARYLRKYDRGTAKYGPSAVKAIKRLQKKRGLKPDGIVGPKTWELLRR